MRVRLGFAARLRRDVFPCASLLYTDRLTDWLAFFMSTNGCAAVPDLGKVNPHTHMQTCNKPVGKTWIFTKRLFGCASPHQRQTGRPDDVSLRRDPFLLFEHTHSRFVVHPQVAVCVCVISWFISRSHFCFCFKPNKRRLEEESGGHSSIRLVFLGLLMSPFPTIIFRVTPLLFDWLRRDDDDDDDDDDDNDRKLLCFVFRHFSCWFHTKIINRRAPIVLHTGKTFDSIPPIGTHS